MEATVVALQVLPKLRHDLDEEHNAFVEWYAPIGMEVLTSDQHERLSLVSDGRVPIVKDIKRQRDTIRRAINWLHEEGYGPALPD